MTHIRMSVQPSVSPLTVFNPFKLTATFLFYERCQYVQNNMVQVKVKDMLKFTNIPVILRKTYKGLKLIGGFLDN